MLVLDSRAQVTDGTGAECAMEDGHGVAARRNAGSGPALCARATMATCASNLWRRTRSTRFAASTEEPEPDRTVRSNTPLRRLIEQAGGHADLERHVPELYDWESDNNEAAPKMRCAIPGAVSWFPGVLQQLWIDVSVQSPHAEDYNESVSKPGVAAVAGEAEKTKRYGTAVRALARAPRVLCGKAIWGHVRASDQLFESAESLSTRQIQMIPISTRQRHS